MSSLWDGYVNGAEYDPADFYEPEFSGNSLYHHTMAKEVSRTKKAILMEDDNGQFWVPKKLVIRMDENLYIWEGFKPSYQVIEGDDLGGEELVI
jgi:hypothetical protein